nr:hypothetical protein GCM10020092_086530 [Actinoplanes digitatis]
MIARRGVVFVGVAGAALFAAGLLARCLPWWLALVVGAVIGGIGLPWTLIAAVTAVQTHTPRAMLGRVSATANTAMFGPIAVATPLGAAAVHLGARPALLIGAAGCLAAAIVVARRRIPSREPCHGSAAEPDVAAEPDLTAGLTTGPDLTAGPGRAAEPAR